jgi:rRNA biogenesis protein RRP5
MGSLKRKEGPNGTSASKSAKPATETRPSKRPRASESAKDDTKKSAKGGAKGAKPAKEPKEPKEPKESREPAAAPIVTKEEEPLFPRGGGSVLTPLEQKQISIQAKKDVLFEEGLQSEGKKRDNSARRKRRKSRADEAGTSTTPDEDAVKVESLNFKVRTYRKAGGGAFH